MFILGKNFFPQNYHHHQYYQKQEQMICFPLENYYLLNLLDSCFVNFEFSLVVKVQTGHTV